MEKLAKFFGVKERGSTIRTEVMAGFTTFMATIFTIIAIPNMINSTVAPAYREPGMVYAVFIAACLSAVFGSLLKAFYAKIPFVQAPGMGLGSYFAGTVMGGMAFMAGAPYLTHLQQYQMGLAVIFIAGVLFTVSTMFGIRELIVNSVPRNIKLAMGAGIGLFITLLGLRFSGIVINSPGTFVMMVNFSDVGLGMDYAGAVSGIFYGRRAMGAILAIVGFLLITILSIKKIKGAILIGVITTTILNYVFGVVSLPDNFSFNLAERFSYFFNLSLFRFDFGFINSNTQWGTLLAFILAFLFVNMFDALGTIYGISMANDLTDEEGNVIGLEKGLTADALGTAASGLLGTSTVTTVVSSASGISEGGRTGLTALTAAVLFTLTLVLAPFVVLVPNMAVAPALIYVGFLMVSHVKEVDFADPTEAIPAFLTVVIMPLSFSIANGIAFGLISYIVIKACTGHIKEIKPLAVVIAFLFVLQYIL